MCQDFLLNDADLKLYTAVFSEQQSHRLFTDLYHNIQWKQEPIKLFGKSVMQPRLTAHYGEQPYSYSGITMNPVPWTPPLQEIKAVVESLGKIKYNAVLLNCYRDGNDYMGWHSDDERELDRKAAIASVSFGATRRFILRRKDNHQQRVEINLNDGDCLIMAGQTQRFWQHSIAKISKTKAAQIAPRINLTFRSILK